MNDLHCPRSFVKSIAPSQCQSKSSFILSIQHSLGLPLFHFPSNLARSALCGIWSVVILSTYSNYQSLLRCTTLCKKVLWLPNTCLMSSFLIFCSKHLYLILILRILDFSLILLTSY